LVRLYAIPDVPDVRGQVASHKGSHFAPALYLLFQSISWFLDYILEQPKNTHCVNYGEYVTDFTVGLQVLVNVFSE